MTLVFRYNLDLALLLAKVPDGDDNGALLSSLYVYGPRQRLLPFSSSVGNNNEATVKMFIILNSPTCATPKAVLYVAANSSRSFNYPEDKFKFIREQQRRVCNTLREESS